MGLFSRKKKEETPKNESELEAGKGGGFVEPVSKTSEELQDLLNEFKEMRAGIRKEESLVDESHDVEHLSETGEEYEITEEDSNAIESYLSGEEDEEEILEEEPVDEDVDAEEVSGEDYIEEEYLEDETAEVEEEILDEEADAEAEFEEPFHEEFEEDDEIEADFAEEEVEETVAEDDYVTDAEVEPVDVEVTINEVPEANEEVEEEEADEEEETVTKAQFDRLIEELEEVSSQVQTAQQPVDAVTNEEMTKKFDDFEKRLLDKIMQQFAMMQVAQNTAQTSQPVVAPAPEPAQVAKKAESEEDEFEISTVDGKLVINGFKFTGEVVMFTPIDSVKKASWEEVVRRKGHCTYHLTTSGNGGWFIKKSNAPNPYAYIEKKEEAEELATIYAKREKAELKIHNAKGVIEKSLSFGREKLRG